MWARVPERDDEYYGEGADEFRQCAPELGEKDLLPPLRLRRLDVIALLEKADVHSFGWEVKPDNRTTTATMATTTTT